MSANVLVVHGGGPTAVINASLYGVVEEAKSSGSIGRVYGAIGGSEGILKESFLDLMQYPEEKLSLLLQTPEGLAVQNPVPVALKYGPDIAFRLLPLSSL